MGFLSNTYTTKEIAGLFSSRADFQKFDNNSGGGKINKKDKRASSDKGDKICTIVHTGCSNKITNRMQSPKIKIECIRKDGVSFVTTDSLSTA